MKKILIACDGSPFGDAGVKTACELIRDLRNPEVRVLTVYELPGPVATEPFVPMPVYTRAIVDGLHANAERMAEGASRVIQSEFPEIAVETCVVIGKPAVEIVNDAREWGSDLIIVGSHGHGFWNRALLGSVSDAVVHNAPCSVLVVRPLEHGNERQIPQANRLGARFDG